MNSQLIEILSQECSSVSRTHLEFFLLANRQILDKVVMLAAKDGEQPHDLYKECLFVDMKTELPSLEDPIDNYLEQMDAIVDSLYYTLNAMTKNALSVSSSIYSLQEMYNDVKEFTVGSASEKKPICNEPTVMSREQILFLVKMILSEYAELLSTVCFSTMDLKSTIEKIYLMPIGEYTLYPYITPSLCSEILTLYCGSFINNWTAMTKDYVKVLFDEVHAANMRKRDPVTGKFIIRESDGKILKPDNWYGPDLKKALLEFKKNEIKEEEESLNKMKEFISKFPTNGTTSIIQETFNALGDDVIVVNTDQEVDFIKSLIA